MLKAQIIHANAIDKLPKVHEQLNDLVSQLQKEDIVSINTTEVSFSGVQTFYSYTVLVVYDAKGQAANG